MEFENPDEVIVLDEHKQSQEFKAYYCHPDYEPLYLGTYKLTFNNVLETN